MRNNMMEMPRRFFIHSVMFGAGIVPIETALVDVNRTLREVDPVEARKMKRKFRKLWRNCMRKEKLMYPSEKRGEAVMRKYGVGLPLGKKHLYKRKSAVFFRFHVDVIDPICKLIEGKKRVEQLF